MPPYSILAAVSVLNLGLVAGLALLWPSARSLPGVVGSALLLVAWGLYPIFGLMADRAPAWAFRALLLGPLYLVWRLWIATLVRVRGDRITWIRTPRREETDEVSS